MIMPNCLSGLQQLDVFGHTITLRGVALQAPKLMKFLEKTPTIQKSSTRVYRFK